MKGVVGLYNYSESELRVYYETKKEKFEREIKFEQDKKEKKGKSLNFIHKKEAR